MSLRLRLVLAFLAFALIPTALLTWFTLDRLGRSIALWNTRGVDRALASSLEVTKTSIARLEASVLSQTDECAGVLAAGPSPAARRLALIATLRGSGLDFLQTYRDSARRWRLLDEAVPAGVLMVVPLDLSDQIGSALAADRMIRSNQGVLAGCARISQDSVVVAGIRVPPSFFDQVRDIGEGIGFYRRFGIVRDVSQTYMLLLVGAVVLALVATSLWVARRLGAGMTSPLRDLESALERVAEGDLEARVRPAGAREVRTLGERFNSMTSALQTTRTALAEAEREAAWREVARRLAHEFKNILTPMSLAVHRLERRAPLVPPEERTAVQDSLGAVHVGVDDLGRLAEQFSQYARLPEPRFEPVDLAEVLASAARLHEPERCRLEARTPGERLRVAGDRLLLSRAIHNLILNAVEASPPGGTVEVLLHRSGSEALLEVLDRGPGIAPEVRGQMFEPYVSTKARGSGLGLSLVRDVAIQHGGSVSLEDREQGGARATLRLPLWKEDGSPAGNG